MKIGILTQPLSYNYGGLLQAYALQTILEREGHEVIILNRPKPYVSDDYKDKFSEKFKRYIKNTVKWLIRRPMTVVYHELTPKQSKVVRRLTDKFVNRYLHKSPDFHSTDELAAYCKQKCINAFVVGSDQCWRPQYSPCLPNYFLDFAKGWKVRRISYAASFGVDYWELTKEETDICVPLAKLFDAMSVREDTGVELCNSYLGVDAVHVLDPTMLLDKENYNVLIDNFDFGCFDIAPEHSLPTINGVQGRTLFNYILDPSAEKHRLIEKLSKNINLSPVYCMPKDWRAQEVYNRCPDECTYPPVELWLQSFRDSEMVIADSYHGMVFSIIYNKPFWVIGNPGRGMARFTSLLKMFDLQDRLITTDMFDTIDYYSPIDWDKVNLRRSELINFSLAFLRNSLSDKL